jgi:OmpA-OmpF porin, OOP family
MNAQRILGSGVAALVVLIVLAILTHDDGTTKPTGPTLPPTAAGELRAHVAQGNLTLDGPVKDAGEKKDIEQAAAKRFGGDNVVSRLQVVATADSAAWLGDVMKALPRKGSGFGTIDIISTKSSLTVSGRVPTSGAGHALLQAVSDESGRTAVDRLRIVGEEGTGGALQAAIDDAVKGRTVSFETGSAAITKSGQTVLRSLIKPLVAAGTERVVVGGYTDNVGDAKANLRLSRARAHSVVVWLEKKGVAKSRLVAKGYGEAKPIAPNSTEAGRRKNRRIEFTVLSG